MFWRALKASSQSSYWYHQNKKFSQHSNFSNRLVHRLIHSFIHSLKWHIWNEAVRWLLAHVCIVNFYVFISSLNSCHLFGFFGFANEWCYVILSYVMHQLFMLLWLSPKLFHLFADIYMLAFLPLFLLLHATCSMSNAPATQRNKHIASCLLSASCFLLFFFCLLFLPASPTFCFSRFRSRNSVCMETGTLLYSCGLCTEYLLQLIMKNGI